MSVGFIGWRRFVPSLCILVAGVEDRACARGWRTFVTYEPRTGVHGRLCAAWVPKYWACVISLDDSPASRVARMVITTGVKVMTLSHSVLRGAVASAADLSF